VRVLLVDDDAAVARSIELMLRIEEINVYRTDLGEEGVDLGISMTMTLYCST
jgi:two-component system cell cycle response regulator CtrA